MAENKRHCNNCGHLKCREARGQLGFTDNYAEYTIEDSDGFSWTRLCAQYRPESTDGENS